MSNQETYISGLPSIEERGEYGIFRTYYTTFYGEENKVMQAGLYFHHTEQDRQGAIKQIDKWVCSPIEVIAKTLDPKGTAGKLISIERTDNGEIEELVINNGDLYKSYENQAVQYLANRAVKINLARDAKALLTRYIAEAEPSEIYCFTDRTGWAGDGITLQDFVLPDCTYGDSSLHIKAGDYNPYQYKDTLDEWKKTIGALSKANPILQLSIMAGFAGALLKGATMTGGGVHFYGASGRGKTTIMQAGASVWGNCATYLRNWDATRTGLEQSALLHNDTLLALDELTGVDANTADSMVYALANGIPKSRGKTSQGDVKASLVKPWRVMTISTGENSINGFIKQSRQGRLQKAGQAVRFLDIPATQQEYGAFDCLHGEEEAKEFAEAVTNASLTHYGTAGRAFVQSLIDTKPDIKNRHSKARNDIAGDAISAEEARGVKLIALLVVAGDLAIEADILPWNKEEPLKAGKLAFSLWQESRGIKGANLAKINVLRRFKQKTVHERHLFINNDIKADNAVIQHSTTIGLYMAKASTNLSEKSYEFLFDREGIEALTDGQIPYKEALDAFYSIGALNHESGKLTRRRTCKATSTPMSYYIVDADTVYSYLDQQEL